MMTTNTPSLLTQKQPYIWEVTIQGITSMLGMMLVLNDMLWTGMV